MDEQTMTARRGDLVEVSLGGQWVPARIEAFTSTLNKYRVFIFSDAQTIDVSKYNVRSMSTEQLEDMALSMHRTIFDGDHSHPNLKQAMPVNHFIQCPFDKNHKIPQGSFQKHLTQCRIRNYDETRHRTCFFNYQHILLNTRDVFEDHLRTCPDRPPDVTVVNNGEGPVAVPRANLDVVVTAEDRYKYFQNVGAGRVTIPTCILPTLNYTCDICNKTFDTHTAWQQHHLSKHRGQPLQQPHSKSVKKLHHKDASDTMATDQCGPSTPITTEPSIPIPTEPSIPAVELLTVPPPKSSASPQLTDPEEPVLPSYWVRLQGLRPDVAACHIEQMLLERSITPEHVLLIPDINTNDANQVAFVEVHTVAARNRVMVLDNTQLKGAVIQMRKVTHEDVDDEMIRMMATLRIHDTKESVRPTALRFNRSSAKINDGKHEVLQPIPDLLLSATAPRRMSAVAAATSIIVNSESPPVPVDKPPLSSSPTSTRVASSTTSLQTVHQPELSSPSQTTPPDLPIDQHVSSSALRLPSSLLSPSQLSPMQQASEPASEPAKTNQLLLPPAPRPSAHALSLLAKAPAFLEQLGKRTGNGSSVDPLRRPTQSPADTQDSMDALTSSTDKIPVVNPSPPVTTSVAGVLHRSTAAAAEPTTPEASTVARKQPTRYLPPALASLLDDEDDDV